MIRDNHVMRQEVLWTRFETHLLNDGLTKKRIEKLRFMFLAAERGLPKGFENSERADIEDLVERLSRNRFRRSDGQQYSGSTKSDIKRFLKQFYKWLRGEGTYFPKEVAWLKTRIGKDERPVEKMVITEDQARALAAQFKQPQLGILTLLLFDSGFRIDEMLSVQRRDLTKETIEDIGEIWFIQCRRSKTYPRRVDVPLFTDDIARFVNTAAIMGMKPEDQLFPVEYATYLKTLHHHSITLFGKAISPHALRHSSATNYASLYKGDRVKLAERFGWSYSAQELDTYVRRGAARQRESAKIVTSNEVVKLQQDNKSLREKLDRLETMFLKSLTTMPKEEAKKRITPELVQKLRETAERAGTRM